MYMYTHAIQEGRTALMVASWRGHLMTVMELLTAGANTDTQDQVSTCMHRIMRTVLCVHVVCRRDLPL